MKTPPKTPIEAVALLLSTAATLELLQALVASGNDKQVGRRALLIAFLLTPELIGTQRELARRMGVSEGRASQMLKAMRQGLSQKSPAS